MAKRKLKKDIGIREKPSDVALKCLLHSFVTIIVSLVIMNAMAYPLLINEIFFITFLMIGLLLCYTYSNIFRFVVYGSMLIVGASLIMVSVFGGNSFGPSFIDTISTGTAPSAFIVIGLNIFFYIFIVLFPSFLMCFLLLAGIVIGLLFTEYGFPVAAFVLLLSALYAVYMLERNTSVYNGASPQNKRMITTPPKMTFKMIVSYILVYVILTTFNIGYAPLLGERADNILSKIQLKIAGIFSASTEPSKPISNLFSLSSMGFGSDGQLGGNVSLSNKHMLTVFTNYEGIKLGGVSYEDYDGRRWYTEEASIPIPAQSKEVKIDNTIFERVLGVNSLYTIEEQKENYNIINLLVRHEKDLLTQSMFTLAKTTNLNFNPSTAGKSIKVTDWQNKVNSVKININEKFQLNTAIPANGLYEITGYDVNKMAPNAKDLILRANRGFYSMSIYDMPRYFDYNTQLDVHLTLENLRVRSDAFYNRYLQLPETLPTRVKDLALELTEGLISDYDKAKAIEKYLRENYTYTLKPGDVPKGKDFVDYFLFESKQGYCTYYATAMTILLRCVGIPTRYVEGFAVPKTNRLGNGGYKVLGSNAHAWPEVYFEGIGFIEFEPTSSYSNTGAEPITSPSPTPDVSSTPRITETPDETATPIPTVTPKTTDNITPTPTADPGVHKPLLSDSQLFILLVILSIIIIFALVVGIMTLKHKMFRNKVIKDKHSSSVIYVYKKIETLLGWYHIPREVTFTLPEYENILLQNNVFNIPDMKDMYDRATILFNKARYSSSSITASDAKAMLDVYDDFIKIEKDRIGLLRYFIHRYILGKI